jgi:hypothetical protein
MSSVCRHRVAARACVLRPRSTQLPEITIAVPLSPAKMVTTSFNGTCLANRIPKQIFFAFRDFMLYLQPIKRMTYNPLMMAP